MKVINEVKKQYQASVNLNNFLKNYFTKGSKENPQSQSNIKKEFESKFDPVIKEFKNHEALNHKFFHYLKERSQYGFNSRQFLIYRDNFLYRTELTIPSVARVIGKAALYGDLQTAANTVSNLSDELGHGDPKKVHSQLLLDSHNVYGEVIFGLDRVKKLKDVEKSKFLLPEVIGYRKNKLEIFNKHFAYIAGNMFAHELAADGMLDNFRQAFFEPYKGYYSSENYEKLIEYFTP